MCREARAALHIIGNICAIRCLLIGPKIFEARAAFGTGKITEQGRGGHLFLITGRVGNSDSMILVTHIFIRFHGAVTRKKGRKGKHRRIHELHGSSQGCQQVCSSSLLF